MMREGGTHPWGAVYNNTVFRLGTQMEQLVTTDRAQSFLQTRLYHDVKTEIRQKRRRNPLDEFFERLSVEGACDWGVRCDCQRRSHIGMLRLLS